MKTERKPVRAETKVVRQWPHERAALINKHERLMRNAEIEARGRADMASRNGAQEALDRVAQSVLSDSDFRKDLLRYAAEEIGASAGAEVARWARAEIDPVLAVRKRVTNAVLASVELGARMDVVAQEPVLRLEARFPERRFYVAHSI